MEVEAIVLAAGFSSRAHKYKMTLEFNNSTVIETCIKNMYGIVDKITVVGGYNYPVIKDLLSKYDKVQLIYNEEYESGMFSSVKAGVNNIQSEKFFLIPGDYVLVEDYIYKELLKFKTKASIVIPSYNSRKGHPVLFKGCNIKHLVNKDFNNLREVINHIGFETFEVNDDGILHDIDTYEDYKFVLEKYMLNKVKIV